MKRFDTGPDTGLPFEQVMARHQAFLDQNQAIKKVYFAGKGEPLVGGRGYGL